MGAAMTTRPDFQTRAIPGPAPYGRAVFAVAPMIDWTDRHCRFFHRQLTARALLYTEMVVADAIIHGPREEALVVQRCRTSGGAAAGRVGSGETRRGGQNCGDYGYDEINLNVGCPSDRVQSGTFGACLMQTPEVVVACVDAMKRVATVPVTVKCRIGVDEQEPADVLPDFLTRMIGAGRMRSGSMRAKPG